MLGPKSNPPEEVCFPSLRHRDQLAHCRL